MPEALSLLYIEVRKNWCMPRSDFQVEQTYCSLFATEEACKKQNRSANKTSFQTSITKTNLYVSLHSSKPNFFLVYW